jgi:hypothetical protein
LAHRGFIEPQEVNTTSWQAFFPDNARQTWSARLQHELGEDEDLLTWALLPDMPGDRAPSTALALTNRRVVAVAYERPTRSWLVAALTSVEIRSSPFASSFRLWTDAAAPDLVLPFPFTLSPSFLEVFLALRQRLTAFS